MSDDTPTIDEMRAAVVGLKFTMRNLPTQVLVLPSTLDDGEVILPWRLLRQWHQFARGYDGHPRFTNDQAFALLHHRLATRGHGGAVYPTRAFMDWFDAQ